MTTSMTLIPFTPLLFAGLLALLFLLVLLLLARGMALMATRHRTHGIPGQFVRLSGLCSLFALGAEQAAIACKRALAATLYWGAVSYAPTSPTLSPSPLIDVMEEGAHASKPVMRLPPGAPTTEMLDSGPPDQLGPSMQAHIPWPGVMILSRLLYLALAVCILLGEYTVKLLRVPAVQYQSQGGQPPLLSLDVTSGLLWLAVAAFWGMLLFEFLDVVPITVQLFPVLHPRLRRVFAGIALVGFVLTTLTVGLLYFTGQLLIQAYSWPLAALIISALQGVLLSCVAVVAIWALVPGAVAIVSLVCFTLTGLFSAAGLLFRAFETLL